MKPRKLNKPVICAVLTLYLFGFISISYAQEKKTQETHGTKSPAAYTENGDITISYGVALETIEALKEFIDSKDQEIDSLKQRLIEIHKSEFDSIPEDADRWATHFLSTMPIRKDQFKSQEQSFDQATKDKRLESDKLQKKIEVLFKFLIDIIDSNINKLKMLGGIKEYEKIDLPHLFREHPNSTPASKKIRKITFNNGSLINIILDTGSLERGLVRSCPNLYFNAKYNNRSGEKLFWIREPKRGQTITFGTPPVIQDVKKPKIADVTYSTKGDFLISKQFKEVFMKSFDEAISHIHYKDSQLSLKASE